MKTLIIGATGTVGMELVKLFSESSYPFLAASRNPDKIEDDGIEKTYFDFYDQTSYRNALIDVDKLFIVPPQGNVRTLHSEVNRFIDFAIGAGVKHITFHSARAVEFITEKFSSHFIEEHLANSDVSNTILRPNWFMQNFNGWFLGMLKQSGGILLPTAEGKSCFVDVRDIAEVAFKTLTESENHNGKTYALAGPDPLSFKDAIDIINKETGNEFSFVDINRDEFVRSSVKRGMNENAARFVAFLFQLVKEGTEEGKVNDINGILGNSRSFKNFVKEYNYIWK